MKKQWLRLMSSSLIVSLLLPGFVQASGGPVAPMIIVADTRRLSGIMAWWANLYNESLPQFTLLTVILIPLIGVIFGIVADIVMTHIGIDLKSRELAEH